MAYDDGLAAGIESVRRAGMLGIGLVVRPGIAV